MGFGFSFKIAPGVRVRASSRGLRTSIGPRAARIHVGAGRTTFSTGAGPITLYTGGGRRRTNSRQRGPRAAVRRTVPAPTRTPRATLAALERQARAVERAEQIAAVARMEHALVTLHHEEFPTATRPVLPPPPRVDTGSFLTVRRRQALNGIGWFARSARRDAKERAAALAYSDALAEQARRDTGHAEAQRAADAAWNDLCTHVPNAVIPALETAFEDNQSPAACVDAGVEHGVRYATVVVIFGTPDMVPERAAAVTPGGRPTLRKRTKTDRNALYGAALGSTVLATVKEAFATVPSLDEVRLMVVRKDPQSSAPSEYVSAIYAARFPRQLTDGLPWHQIDPTEMLVRAPEAQLLRKGVAREIVALDLVTEPGLASVLDSLRSEFENTAISG